MKFVCYTIKTIYPPVIEGDDERVEYFAREIPCCNGVSVNDAIEIAKRESYNGEYTIEDNGEPESPPTTEQRVSVLEEQLAQSDETAIALYEAQEAQETINAQQDEALMEIYEMIG